MVHVRDDAEIANVRRVCSEGRKIRRREVCRLQHCCVLPALDARAEWEGGVGRGGGAERDVPSRTHHWLIGTGLGSLAAGGHHHHFQVPQLEVELAAVLPLLAVPLACSAVRRQKA